ncbi:unnamed protein product [Timema podura]|uniref:Uncharacterized protein n=1 Tax=Timema podura TaxID=61482 RepID=A0ABN7NMU3_TIMPD|nr:unnamed protein product [Timema podura]
METTHHYSALDPQHNKNPLTFNDNDNVLISGYSSPGLMDTPALHLSNDRLSCMESSCSTITKFSVTRADQSSECSLINTAATSTKLHILSERLHLTATMNQIVSTVFVLTSRHSGYSG